MSVACWSWPAATTAARGADDLHVRGSGGGRAGRVSDAEEGVSGAESALATAHQDFCGAAKGYVEILDRYGRVFTDRSATVGDVQTLGADLVEPRDEVVASADAVETAKNDLATAQQELVDAQAALAAAIATASSVPVSSTAPTTITTTTLVPAATIERVQLAEDDLARTARESTLTPRSSTPVRPTTRPRSHSRSPGCSCSNDADCLSEQRQADALAQLTAYTTALQTDLEAGRL